MSNRYGLYPASFVHAGGTLTLIQLGAANASMNQQFDEHIPGGLLQRQAVVLQTAAPTCDLQTDDLVTAFGVISPTAGLSCTGACEFQYQKRADQGTYAGGSTNGVMSATKGFLVPMSLGAANSGRATLGLQFFPLFDGTNEPLVFTAAQALEGTPAYNSSFYHGPVYVNGVQIVGNLSTSINFGVRFVPNYEDGTVFPMVGSVYQLDPTISLTFANIAAAQAATSMFINALAGTIAVYFAKGVPSGKRVANATTSHCKVSAAAGQWGTDSINVSGNDDATATITIRPTGALAVSVASSIP